MKRSIVSSVMRIRAICLTLVPLLCALLVITGCGGTKQPSISDINQQTVTVLNVFATFYSKYLSLHHGKPPKDYAAFRKFLESRTDSLEQHNIKDLEQLFNSPRDAQPFTVVYDKRIAVSDSPGTFWAAYEQTGVDGKRMAVRTYGGVDLLDAEQFAREFQ